MRFTARSTQQGGWAEESVSKSISQHALIVSSKYADIQPESEHASPVSR